MNIDLKRLRILEIMLDDLNQGVIICDSKGKIILYNKAYSRIDNLSQDQVLDKPIEKSYSMKKSESILMKVMKTKQPMFLHRQQYTTINGTSVDVVKDTYPLTDGSDVIGAFAIVRHFKDAKIWADNIIKEAHNNSSLQEIDDILDFNDLPYKNTKMNQCINKIKLALKNNYNIAIFGEKGVEFKEIAKYIACNSTINNSFYKYFDCASSPPELIDRILFRNSEKGEFSIFSGVDNETVILENVERIPQLLQLKLLKLLKNNKVRIISIFNNSTDKIIEENNIILELFYALNEINIYIPTVNERKEDLGMIVEKVTNHYAKMYNKKIKISLAAYRVLIFYNWPGNYLQLKNTIRSAVLSINNKTLDIDNLPEYLKTNINVNKDKDNVLYYSTLNAALEYTESEMISAAMNRNNNNITKAAEDLGIKRQNLQYRLKKLNL